MSKKAEDQIIYKSAQQQDEEEDEEEEDSGEETTAEEMDEFFNKRMQTLHFTLTIILQFNRSCKTQ